jgi:hypothetical protein
MCYVYVYFVQIVNVPITAFANLQITPYITTNDGRDYITHTADATSAIVIMGADDDVFEANNPQTTVHICGDYCSVSQGVYMAAMPSSYDGNDVINVISQSFLGVGCGGNDNMTTTTTLTVVQIGDYGTLTRSSSIFITEPSITNTHDDVLSAISGPTTWLAMIGGTGNDTINLFTEPGSNPINAFICGDSCSLEYNLLTAGSLLSDTSSISSDGNDIITVTNVQSPFIIGGGASDSIIATNVAQSVIIGDFGVLSTIVSSVLGNIDTTPSSTNTDYLDGLDIISTTVSATGTSIVFGCGGNDIITTIGTSSTNILIGDYALVTNNNGLSITSQQITASVGTYSDRLISQNANGQSFIFGGADDDTINGTSATGNIVICGDTCIATLPLYNGAVGAVAGNIYYTESLPNIDRAGNDQILVTGINGATSNSSSLIIGGGGQLDNIQAQGGYQAICADHCFGNSISNCCLFVCH